MDPLRRKKTHLCTSPKIAFSGQLSAISERKYSPSHSFADRFLFRSPYQSWSASGNRKGVREQAGGFNER
jgi:hypothetical protein